MEFWKIIVLWTISHIIIQIGITFRRIVIERNKLKRIEKLASLDCSKIMAISDYKNKGSSLRSE